MNKILWEPTADEISNSHINILRKKINKKYKLKLRNYNDLHSWSIENISEFWGYVWKDLNIKFSKNYSQVIDNPRKMPGARWFKSSKFNFSENLLSKKSNDIAIEFYGENKIAKKITYNDLNRQVIKVAVALKKLGIKKGDRVAAIMPNIPETVISMLAASSIGAVWSSCSPDFGEKSILDRFIQINPKLIIASDGYYYKGKNIKLENKIKNVFSQIKEAENVIIVNYINDNIDFDYILWENLINTDITNSFHFKQLPFSHPLYIMYSSGTTGKPKSIVHSSGGTLLQQLKEMKYHVNVFENDKIFYYTTCGWMMWNWLISALYFGSTIVLYDGNPFYPNDISLLKKMDEIGITIFGTSAKYISHLKSINIKPNSFFKFNKLKTILSTGSPLTDDLFDFVYQFWKKDVQLSSISGGTDIISCFALGNPALPVRKGELQCLGLGMSVKSFDENGKHNLNLKGELVCDRAFPSMPIYFWDDDENKQYKNSYFSTYINIWKHGDYILINHNGGVIIYGRSDSTLNPSGVRIGTSEIYQVVNQIPSIIDSVVVAKKVKSDEKIILFVKINKNNILDEKMINLIKSNIRSNCTSRHVPHIILQVGDIPYTINGKKVEIAVKNIVNNEKIVNVSSLSNPASLEEYKNFKDL